MTDHFEVIAAFADGEHVEADALKDALATDVGRDYLIDVLALRGLVGDGAPQQAGRLAPARDGATASSSTSLRWLSGIAALIVAGTAGGFFVGRQSTVPQNVVAAPPAVSVQAMPPELRIPAPSPTRVIKLENGKDWNERAGGN